MGFLIRLLAGRAGVAVLLAVAVAFAGLSGGLWLQTKRNAALNRDLGAARTIAQTNYDRALAWKRNSGAWQAFAGTLEAVRVTERDTRAKAVERSTDDRSAANSSAFDQGYRAGIVAGRKTGAPHATPAPNADADPRGVRIQPEDDLRAVWGRSAYRPR